MDFTVIAFYMVAIAFAFIAAFDFFYPIIYPLLPIPANNVIAPSEWAIAFLDIENSELILS